MDKQEWCTTHFGSELPDCLPLPELRETEGGTWSRFSLPVDTRPEAAELAATVLYLLGVYGGLNEAGLLVWNGNGCQPLRQEWKPDMTPGQLTELAKNRLQEGGAFSWDEGEAVEVLGVEAGRRVAFSLTGEIPPAQCEGLALAFCLAPRGLVISYDNSLYTEPFIRVMALSWREIIVSFSAAGTLAGVCITAEETRGVLDRFNETVHAYDKTATIIEQFCASSTTYSILCSSKSTSGS
jgi:hypothetical protein